MGNYQYKKLLKENITKTYKKSNKQKIKNMKQTEKIITNYQKSLQDRVELMEEIDACITTKKSFSTKLMNQQSA